MTIEEEKAMYQKRDQEFRQIIAEKNLVHDGFYWIRLKTETEGWGLAQCSMGIEEAPDVEGFIYAINFHFIGYEYPYDYNEITLGPKIEIGEPPT